MAELQESCHKKVRQLQQLHREQLSAAQATAAAALTAAAAPAASAAVAGTNLNKILYVSVLVVASPVAKNAIFLGGLTVR